uniref:Proteasome subunit beta n=1 Tax=Stegastes partitus TaxID=144197 RepID=A0A3B5AL95_9TELE
ITMLGETGPEWTTEEVTTGTTIIAIEFAGGVVLGSDSRVSAGATVVNRVMNKLSPLHDRIYCALSGSAADAQTIAEMVNYQLDVHRHCCLVINNNGQDANSSSYREHSDLLNPNTYTAGINVILKLLNVFATLNGLLTRQPFAIGGSGSSYVYGFVDAEYRKDMSKEECQQFVVNTLALAMNRDGSSGGVAYMVTIDEHNTEEKVVLGNDLPTFFDQ